MCIVSAIDYLLGHVRKRRLRGCSKAAVKSRSVAYSSSPQTHWLVPKTALDSDNRLSTHARCIREHGWLSKAISLKLVEGV